MHISELLAQLTEIDSTARAVEFLYSQKWQNEFEANPLKDILVESEIKPYLTAMESCAACRKTADIEELPPGCPGELFAVDVRGSEFYQTLKFASRTCPRVASVKRGMKMQEILKASDIPYAFATAGFDNFKCANPKQENALKQCTNYAMKFSKFAQKGVGLYLYSPFGKAGCGKTHLSVSVLRSVAQYYVTGVKFVNLVASFAAYKKAVWNSETSEHAFAMLPEIAEFEGLLVVDDIGTENPSTKLLETTYHIVNHRYENFLPTIYTSNYDVSSLGSRVYGNMTGEKIVSRISGRCIQIEVDGPNLRGDELASLLSEIGEG